LIYLSRAFFRNLLLRHRYENRTEAFSTNGTLRNDRMWSNGP